jgi:hypothetical protein
MVETGVRVSPPVHDTHLMYCTREGGGRAHVTDYQAEDLLILSLRALYSLCAYGSSYPVEEGRNKQAVRMAMLREGEGGGGGGGGSGTRSGAGLGAGDGMGTGTRTGAGARDGGTEEEEEKKTENIGEKVVSLLLRIADMCASGLLHLDLTDMVSLSVLRDR